MPSSRWRYRCWARCSFALRRAHRSAAPANRARPRLWARPAELPAGRRHGDIDQPGRGANQRDLFRPGLMPPVSAPLSYTPSPKPLPRLALDTPAWFDFSREQAQSVVFDVDAPGLYSATTQGLLATSCVLRTPVIQNFAQDQGGGRSRNCLMQTWLQKGRYLMTASTVGQSTGRAGLVLSRRPVREFASVTGEGEQYFRVEGNELVQQTLAVRTEGRYQLSTTAQGAAGLQCRIDDPEGWPLERVPTSCAGERALRPRHLAVDSAAAHRGVDATHHAEEGARRGGLHGRHQDPPARLLHLVPRRAGQRRQRQTSPSHSRVRPSDVVLTNGMQGRLYLLEKDKPPKAVEARSPRRSSRPTEEAVAPEQQEEQASEYAESSDGYVRGEEGEGGDEPPPARPPVELARAVNAPPPPAGVRLKLGAGPCQAHHRAQPWRRRGRVPAASGHRDPAARHDSHAADAIASSHLHSA